MFNESVLFESLSLALGSLVIPDLIHIIADYAYEFKCRWEAPCDGTYQISSEGMEVEVLSSDLTVVMGTMALPQASETTWSLASSEHMTDVYIGLSSRHISTQDVQRVLIHDAEKDPTIHIYHAKKIFLDTLNFWVDTKQGLFECIVLNHLDNTDLSFEMNVDPKQTWYPFMAFDRVQGHRYEVID